MKRTIIKIENNKEQVGHGKSFGGPEKKELLFIIIY